MKVSLMAVGIFILGVSISLLRYGRMGTDPYTTMNLGVSSALNLSFGTYQLAVNIILFLIVLKKKRETIGLGTFVNMVMVGYTSDVFYGVVTHYFPEDPSFLLRMNVTLVAVLIAAIGISMYMESELGIAPYDAVTNILLDYTAGKLPYFVARMIIDVSAVSIGFLFGATVGLGTLLLAFLTGPVVQIIREKVLRKLLKLDGPEIKLV